MRPLRSRPRRRALAGLAAGLVLPLAGCVGMPQSGPVVSTGSEGNLDEQTGIYIDPKPPQPGDLPGDIVAGFLDAMTATPIQTNTAQEFLTREAQASWDPEGGTVTYGEASSPQGFSEITVRLRDAEHLDGRGAYLGTLPPERRVLRLPMQREEGEWRIARAPNALIVPESWFEQRFRRVSVYYFDPSADILVPEPVYVPVGEQLATALTKALLRGPGQALEGVSRTFIPAGVTFGLSVPVTEDGVAELTLRGYGGRLTPESSRLMLAQLAWTLRQDPGIEAVRVVLGGQQVTLPGGVSQLQVEQGSAYDPTGLQASTMLYALRDGLLVSGPPDGLTAVDGPMGRTDLGVRTISVNLDGTRVAGVSADGSRLLLTSVRGPGERVVQVVSGGSSLLRPAWDHSDRLWLVDARPDGALVSYVDRRRPRELAVPGITGRDVTRLLVSRDGSRLVAVVHHPRGDQVVVSRVRRDAGGRVVGTTPAQVVSWRGESNLRIRDIGWSSPTSVAVLHKVAKQLYQVRTISVDGAPPDVDDLLTTLPGRVRSLASSPAETDSLFAVTDTGLFDPRGENAGAPLDPEVSVIGYVG